jgi:hypothetical protein
MPAAQVYNGDIDWIWARIRHDWIFDDKDPVLPLAGPIGALIANAGVRWQS